VQVIRTFVHRLPGFVEIETREKAEGHGRGCTGAANEYESP
jgi:hypothetical protein